MVGAWKGGAEGYVRNRIEIVIVDIFRKHKNHLTPLMSENVILLVCPAKYEKRLKFVGMMRGKYPSANTTRR